MTPGPTAPAPMAATPRGGEGEESRPPGGSGHLGIHAVLGVHWLLVSSAVDSSATFPTAGGGNGARAVPAIDGMLPRGLLPPAHAQKTLAPPDAPPAGLSLLKYAPVAPELRRCVVEDAIA